jgi:hypothetical protein
MLRENKSRMSSFEPPEPNWDNLLRRAIEEKRLIQVIYHGKERIVEPHDYGIRNNTALLLAFQIAGSSSRQLPNWILMKVDEIEGIDPLGPTFPGRRPTPSGKHLKWTTLFIRVKPPDEDPQGGSQSQAA